MPTYVFTLEPADPLFNKIQKIKSVAQNLVGDQLYLSDPPHLTLYLGRFTSHQWWQDHLQTFINQINQEIYIPINSWHTFANDSVTGNDTLVCNIDPNSSSILWSIQQQLISLLHPFREPGLIQRYQHSYNELPEIFRKNLDQFGYPFVGDIWKPHLGIASFKHSVFGTIWEKIKDECPIGYHYFSSLVVYRLDESTEHLTLIAKYPLKYNKPMLKRLLREEVCQANKDLVKYNLVQFTWGNVSCIDRYDGIVAIKPSGISYEVLSPDDIVLVDLNGNIVDGNKKPSTDTPTHLEIYKSFSNVNAIVHTHSTYATIFAQAKKTINCLGTTHADHFFGPIPVTRDLTPNEISQEYESNTGKVIVQHFTQNQIDPDKIPACLVASHGPFVWATTPEKAVHQSVVLEQLAQMNLQTTTLNPNQTPIDNTLLNKHFFRKNGTNSYYGQASETK